MKKIEKKIKKSDNIAVFVHANPDGDAIGSIVAFSTAPLVLASLFGLLFCFLAFVLIVVVIVKTLAFGDPVAGWPSLVCIIFMVSGIQLFCSGIIGQYLSKTY